MNRRPKWQVALDNGEIWRAKEILRSYIKITYDPDIYKSYGEILYDLQDYEEAGKYLFMAGENPSGKYAKAITLFLKRHERAEIEQFLSNFPKRFVSEPFEHYPERVRFYLSNRGYEKKLQDIQEKCKDDQIPFWLRIIGVMAILLVFLSMIVGFVTIVNWLLE